MAALALFLGDMRFGAAYRASFFPGLLYRLRNLGLRGFRGAQSHESRLVGLFDGTLWVNASERVRRFSTHRTEMLRRWHDQDGFFAAHGELTEIAVGESVEFCLARGVSATRFKTRGREVDAPRPVLFHVLSPSIISGCRIRGRHHRRRNRRHRCATLLAEPR